jgi:hypothetical protein
MKRLAGSKVVDAANEFLIFLYIKNRLQLAGIGTLATKF